MEHGSTGFVDGLLEVSLGQFKVFLPVASTAVGGTIVVLGAWEALYADLLTLTVHRCYVVAACLVAPCFKGDTANQSVYIGLGEVVLCRRGEVRSLSQRVHQRFYLLQFGQNDIVDGVARGQSLRCLAEFILEWHVAKVLNKLSIGCCAHGNCLSVELAHGCWSSLLHHSCIATRLLYGRSHGIGLAYE